MGLLGEIYSTIDSKKRQLKGLLSDPVETIRQGLLNFRDDQNKLLNDFGVGYQTPGYKSVLTSPEQVKAARQSVADWGANQGIGAATVWHGSPHKFNKFDSSKIGTGEGAQAYGHGLYLAESRGVAESYADKLAQNAKLQTADGQVINFGPPQQRTLSYANNNRGSSQYAIEPWQEVLSLNGGNFRKATNGAKKQLQEALDSLEREKALGIDFGASEQVKRWQSILDGLKTKGKGAVYDPGQYMYKVDLPDEAIAKMLDWDKPLSQQPAFDSLQQLARKRAIDDATYQATEAARKQLPKRPINEADWMNAIFSGASQADDALLKELTQKEMAKLDIAALTEKQLQSMKHPSQTWEMLGKNFYEALSNSTDAKRASDLLKSQGIPGIKYWDGGSRGAGQGTSNYVVFPGNENLLTILERNGQPVGLLD